MIDGVTLDTMPAVGPFWYLGTPYSRYPGGMEAAFQMACRAAGRLINSGISVFSPIAHSHPIASHSLVDAMDLDLWLMADAPFMEAAGGLLVADMPSWEDSKGIAHEIEVFNAAGKPVYLWRDWH